MALAVTHVILTIVILDIFRHYVFGLKKFPRHLLIIGSIAGLAPDIDIPIGWSISLISGQTVNLHGLFTHSLIIPLFFLAAAVALHYKKNMNLAKIFYVIAAGWFLHLCLDCLFGGTLAIGYKHFFWPMSINNFCPQLMIQEYAAGIDAIILIFWLIHEEIHHRIKDYI